MYCNVLYCIGVQRLSHNPSATIAIPLVAGFWCRRKKVSGLDEGGMGVDFGWKRLSLGERGWLGW